MRVPDNGGVLDSGGGALDRGGDLAKKDVSAPAFKSCTFACTVDADCTSPLKCHPNSGKCVVCITDTDCKVGPKKCNTTMGFCKLCEKDADCTYGVMECDVATSFCKLCKKDADCYIAGTMILTGKCDGKIGQCTRCTEDKDCDYAGSVTKKCDLSKSICAYATPTTCDTTWCKTPLLCKGDKCTCASDADCTTAFGKGYTCK